MLDLWQSKIVHKCILISKLYMRIRYSSSLPCTIDVIIMKTRCIDFLRVVHVVVIARRLITGHGMFKDISGSSISPNFVKMYSCQVENMGCFSLSRQNRYLPSYYVHYKCVAQLLCHQRKAMHTSTMTFYLFIYFIYMSIS